ncbi:MAG: PEGA domain-containing protein [Spirochaetaceae bacterium]|nr:MAG: PEGA domain-containing protein [Spirochaetaceae bacterium]
MKRPLPPLPVLLNSLILAALLLTAPPAAVAQIWGGLHVRSAPSGAEVLLDGVSRGRTPLLLEDLVPGRSKLRLEYRGHEPWEEWVLVEAGRTLTLNVELPPRGGSLTVLSNAPDPEVFIRDRWVPAGETGLAPGRRTLRFRAFGYQELLLPVEIHPEEATLLELSFREAPLEEPRVHLSRPSFHPDNPGPYGEIALLLEINGPASLVREIRRASDSRVIERIEMDLVARETVILWDGRESGAPSPEGTYEMSLTLTGKHEGERYQVTRSVSLDRSVLIHPRISGSYGPGTTLLPVPEKRKQQTLLLGFSAGLIAGDSPSVPVELGLSWYALERLILTGTASVTGDPEQDRPLYAAAGTVLFTPPVLARGDILQGALRLGGGGGPESSLEAGVPVRFGRSGGALGLLAEAGFGVYGEEAFPETPAPYGALGLYRERARYMLGASARLYSGDKVLTAADLLLRPARAPVYLRLTAIIPAGTGETTLLLGLSFLP